MNFLYFAYGSNMLPTRLQARCPSARIVGCGAAVGFDLEFSKVSKDGSGKATLTERPNAVTPGLLYEIANAELRELDKAEGVGSGYDRLNDFMIRNDANGANVLATTYLATAIDSSLVPYDWYLALIIAGACKHGLDNRHIEHLRQIRYVTDADHDRKARRDASDAFRSDGIDDYRLLLRGTA